MQIDFESVFPLNRQLRPCISTSYMKDSGVLLLSGRRGVNVVGCGKMRYMSEGAVLAARALVDRVPRLGRCRLARQAKARAWWQLSTSLKWVSNSPSPTFNANRWRARLRYSSSLVM
jgi:hypothetical protein